MPSEPAYQLHRPARVSASSGGALRDASPDSLIFTPESNLSLFSSASVDRCSFASDAQDPDSLVLSDLSMDRDHRGISSCTDLDPNKLSTVRKHSRNSRKADKVKVQKEENEVTEDESQHLDSARSSFSLALKECQDRRSRSEALTKKLDKQRTPSLDLNNVISSSPQLVTVTRNSISTKKSSAFPSPGTPTYLHGSSIAMPKGWSSERVPSCSNGARSQANAAFMPLYGGKTLPSKWEDAERWIFSPVAREGLRTSFGASHERRPKSKSGPLGPPGVAYYSLYSSAVPVIEGGSMGSFMVGSPFSAGVVGADGHSGDSSAAFPSRLDPCIARSISIHGCTETLAPPLLPSQDDILTNIKDAATNPRAASRRDMATQMSPEGSVHLSPERRSSFSPSSSSALPIMDIVNGRTSKSEVKDLQVDGKVTVTRWSRKHGALYHGKSTEMQENLNEKSMNTRNMTWAKREDARINAWETLQKAKAEAAIRKLEMKLEKKRRTSMEKIMKKLKSAQKRAQDMRSSVLANNVQQGSSKSRKVVSFRRTRPMASISGCFTCYAL